MHGSKCNNPQTSTGVDCENEDRKLIYDIRQEISNLQAQVENAWKEQPF